MPRHPSLLPPIPPRRRTGPNGPARPIRVEIVLALAAGLILLAVPLYLWRKPAAMNGSGSPPEIVAEADANLVIDASPREADAPPKVKLAEGRTLKCGDGPTANLPEGRCDRIPALEQALTKAILENSDCAPVSIETSTVSFVLTVDFAQQKLHLWPGKSGSLRRPKANDLLRCVKRGLSLSDWASIPHQHRHYEIGVMATYRAGVE